MCVFIQIVARIQSLEDVRLRSPFPCRLSAEGRFQLLEATHMLWRGLHSSILRASKGQLGPHASDLSFFCCSLTHCSQETYTGPTWLPI